MTPKSSRLRAPARDAAAVHAGRIAVRAADLAEQGLDWAAPRAQVALASAPSAPPPCRVRN